MKNEQDQSSQITSEMRHFPSKNMKLPYRQCLNHRCHGIIPVYTIIPYFMVYYGLNGDVDHSKMRKFDSQKKKEKNHVPEIFF